MSFYSLRQLEAINQKVHEIQSNWMPATQTLTEMRNWFNGYRAAAFQRLVAEEPWEIAYTEQDMKNKLDAYRKSESIYVPTIVDQTEQELFDKSSKLFDDYLKGSEQMFVLVHENKSPVELVGV